MNEMYNDIDALISKFLAGEATPEEAALLHAWAEKSDENKKLLEASETAWDLNNSSYQNPDTAKIFQSLNLTKTGRQIRFTPLRIAASILLIICLGSLAYLLMRPTVSEENWITKASSEQPFVWQLPEKTVVTLNDSSQLRYPKMFNKNRAVELTGEAYFDVTPDPQKPFVISADVVEIKVLGTAFNVSAYGSDTIVSVQVVHGSVLMKHKMDSLVLEAGQKGFYHKKTQKLWMEKPETHNNIGYATHTFTYTDKSLGQILDDLAVAYGVTFTIENDAVKNCHLTGEYHSMDLPVILEVISKSLDLTYNINGNRVYISGDGCL